MQLLQTRKQQIYYDPTLINKDIELIFDSQYWQKKNLIVGSASGRGTTWFVKMPTINGALRHYCRGGLFGKIISDHYLFLGWNKTRSLQEFKLLEQLSQEGVNVPRPIAARVIKKTFTYQADLLSEKIPDAQDLVAILQKQSLADTIYRKIGLEIQKMHNIQVNHSDLNIHNILIDKNNRVWIIDFDKCAKHDGEHWKNKNLQRLKRSFVKEVKKRAIHWHEADWNTVLAGYRA
ncbi:MAG: 3-deoxy-D-manno-octulosonic acid kinase [Psychromonas sp.]|nr:3-deoxy-D-manno-octulosonic acid kinase [Psychromonas sp.]